ncbi:claudin-4-like [Eucyclogobius newberryi]|uniref:claudin-4-like n=1 Tax=Eucyclogobius newberryi TaxID=166745 RepID=UPI003B5C3E53
MAGQYMQMWGLTLGFMGILGVALTCGLPMWRETSFVGANVVTAQLVWDGLWLHCVVQATGQIQCKRHSAPSLTADLQAGRALTLISIVCGFLGFMVVMFGGGVVNYSGEDPDPTRYESRSTRKKVRILGGVLCALAGVLCLISVSWSAGITTFINNDPLVITALKRDIGSSVYIGLVSSVLLLLAALLIGLVCWDKDTPPPPSSDYYMDTGSTPNRTSQNARSPESLYRQTLQKYSIEFPDLWTPPIIL